MKNSKTLMFLFSSFIFSPIHSFAQEGAGTEAHVNAGYVGTYTKKEGHVDGKAEGIYAITQDPKTGALSLEGTVAEVTNPSYVKTSPDGKYLYAVSELGPGMPNQDLCMLSGYFPTSSWKRSTQSPLWDLPHVI